MWRRSTSQGERWTWSASGWRPGGRLYLFSQAPEWTRPHSAEQFAAELGNVLDGAGFAVERVIIGDLGQAFAAGVVARAL
jgi:hypothetical protein